MANVDDLLVKQVLDGAQRKWKSNIHHDRELDDLGPGFEVAERVLGHFFQG